MRNNKFNKIQINYQLFTKSDSTTKKQAFTGISLKTKY